MVLKIYPEDMRPVDKDVHSRLWPIENRQLLRPEKPAEIISNPEKPAEPISNPDKKHHALVALDIANKKRDKILERYPELAYFEHLTILKVAEIVSSYYELNINQVLSHRRTRKFVHTRFVIYFFCRELLSKSLPEIGRCLRGRDHSTVIHGIARFMKLLKTDEALASDVENLRGIFLEVKKNRAGL